LVFVPIGPDRSDLIESRPRILVLHNFSRSEKASGEDLSGLDEIAASRERGH
jgi:hypothetical protein